MEVALSVSIDKFLSEWGALDTEEALRAFLEQHVQSIDDALFDRMKARANEISDSNIVIAVKLVKSLTYAAQLTGRPLQQCWAFSAQGNAARWQGEYRAAVTFYDQARDVALQIKNELEAARSQIGKVHALIMLGQHDEAIKIGTEIDAVLIKYNQWAAVVNLSFNLGICYYQMAEIDQSLAIYNRSAQILEENVTLSWRDSLLADVKYNYSLSLAIRNDFQEALQTASLALEIQQNLGNQATIAVYQETIGFYYLHLGQFTRALRLLDDARQVFEANTMREYLVYCDLYAAQCYIGLNNFKRAEEFCQRVLEQLQLEQLNNSRQAGWANHYLGISLFFLGKYDRAFEVLEVSRQIYRGIGKGAEEANPTLDLAEFKFRLGENSEAEILAIKALTIFRQVEMPGNAARCEILLGRIYLAQQKWDEAERLANRAMVAARKTQLPIALYSATLLEAEIAEQRGQEGYALDYYLKAMSVVEELRGRVTVEQRASFLEDKEAAYEGAVALSLNLSSPSEVLELVERGKSRGLMELITGNLDVRIRLRSEADRPIVSELETLRTRRNDLVNHLAYWNSTAALSPAGEVKIKAAEESKWDELQAEVKQVEKGIGELVERLQYRNATYTEDPALHLYKENQVSEYLEADTALVEYYIYRNQVLAMVNTGKDLVLEKSVCTLNVIQRGLASFGNNLVMVSKDIGTGQTRAERRFNTTKSSIICLSQLYDCLIKPLEPELKKYRKLIFIPHKILHRLPFHALFNQSSGKFMAEEWQEISYLPSSNLLGICQGRGKRSGAERGRGALVMGYSSNGNLLHCKREAQTIANLISTRALEGSCTLYLEDEVTLQHFEQEAGEKLLIHLATHAELRQDDPLFSGLELADGQITALDLINSELKASLVTLSACQTGLGKLGGGDELLGLSRACIYAGASTLALSLWMVEDNSAAQFMQTFYGELFNGKSKGEALRTAQLGLIGTDEYRHPFFWAPFTLVGHTGTL